MRKIESIVFVLILLLVFFSGCNTVDTINTVTEVNDSSESKYIDSDSDGWTDVVDKFPFDPSAYLDSDDDGYPDNWIYNKTQKDSTSDPLLEIDMFPYDPSECCDSDLDGFGDNKDLFPMDPDEHLDSDYDTVGDNKDINSLVDLSFTLYLDKFKLKKRVDFFRWAQIYFTVYVNGELVKTIDNNDDFWDTKIGNIKNIEETITFDVNDNTSNLVTNIEIFMMDYDIIGSDDVVEKIVLDLYNIENTLFFNNPYIGSNGELWFNIVLPESKTVKKTLDRYYKWVFDGVEFDLDFEIPIVTYEKYSHDPVDRIPQRSSEDAMVSFITFNDDVVKDLTKSLRSLSIKNSFNSVKTVNFILSFVQNIVSYQSDNKTTGYEEYWRFPVETLVEMHGDCEDTAVLFAAIMKNLDYDVVLLYYTFEDTNLGHLSVGVNINDAAGDYVIESGKKYYYCETTTQSYKIGELPPDINTTPESIIPIK